MLILIPWKPVVLFVCVMAALILGSYVASSFLEGKNPFAQDWNNAMRLAHPASAQHAAAAAPKPPEDNGALNHP